MLRRPQHALRLLIICAVSACGSWLLSGAPLPGSSADASGRPVAAHAVWNRHTDLRQLMRPTEVVVKATVVAVEAGPTITASDAGAAAGSPDIPQQRVTFRTDEVAFGSSPGTTFTVLHALPPEGTTFPEDPPYVAGQKNLLFLAPAVGPGRHAPRIDGVWQRVGIDGRLPIDRNGQAKGLMPNGPGPEINKAMGDLRRVLAEAKRP